MDWLSSCAAVHAKEERQLVNGAGPFNQNCLILSVREGTVGGRSPERLNENASRPSVAGAVSLQTMLIARRYNTATVARSRIA